MISMNNLAVTNHVEETPNMNEKIPDETNPDYIKMISLNNLPATNHVEETPNMNEKIPEETNAGSETDSLIKKGHRKISFKIAGKKRKKTDNEVMSKSKLRKYLRNTGQEYMTKKGKVIKAKLFEDKDCGCSKKCNTKITCEQRQKCFDKFWKMGDFGKQNAYLSGLVTREAVKQHRPRLNCTNRGPKGVTYQYRINVGRFSKVVCKKYFLQTFLVSDGRLSRALRKEENEREPGEDLRGKKPPANKTSEEQLERVRDHINQFPRYDIHYTQNPKGKFLKFDLNVKKMYGMYVDQCNTNNTPFVKENIYRSVFNEEFNLSFLSPRRDSCNKNGSESIKTTGSSRKKNAKAFMNQMGLVGVRPPIPQVQQTIPQAQSMMHQQKFPYPTQLFCATDASKLGYNHINASSSLENQEKNNLYNHCQTVLPTQTAFFTQEQNLHHTYPNQTQSFFNL